jgi:hypothetical protein
VIRIKREDYEERVVATLRREVLERAPKLEGDAALTHRGNLVTVEEIGMDASEPRHRIYFLFLEESRPECLFGFHAIAVEPDCDPGGVTWVTGYRDWDSVTD